MLLLRDSLESIFLTHKHLYIFYQTLSETFVDGHGNPHIIGDTSKGQMGFQTVHMEGSNSQSIPQQPYVTIRCKGNKKKTKHKRPALPIFSGFPVLIFITSSLPVSQSFSSFIITSPTTAPSTFTFSCVPIAFCTQFLDFLLSQKVNSKTMLDFNREENLCWFAWLLFTPIQKATTHQETQPSRRL